MELNNCSNNLFHPLTKYFERFCAQNSGIIMSILNLQIWKNALIGSRGHQNHLEEPPDLKTALFEPKQYRLISPFSEMLRSVSDPEYCHLSILDLLELTCGARSPRSKRQKRHNSTITRDRDGSQIWNQNVAPGPLFEPFCSHICVFALPNGAWRTDWLTDGHTRKS